MGSATSLFTWWENGLSPYKVLPPIPGQLPLLPATFSIPDLNLTIPRSWLMLGPVVVIVVGCIYCYSSTSLQLKQAKSKAKRLSKENTHLSTQSRQLYLHSSNLKKKADQLQEENDRALLRSQTLEAKLLELVSTILTQNPSTQLQLIKSIYKEQVLELSSENSRLKNKIDCMRGELECSVCMSQEANCLLRPCGHSICTECYYEIRRSMSILEPHSKLPLCPFCRKEISELIPKFHS